MVIIMEHSNTFKQFLQRYMHIILPAVYGLLYLYAFDYLEKHVTTHYHIVHVWIDDYIPFCEIFVIPYLLWFLYVAVTVISFMSLDRTDYYRLCIMLAVGMTVFIVVSFLFPNGHQLRPHTFTRDNIFIRLVQNLYKTDTSTNLFPSIHCYNALACHIAIHNSSELKSKKWLQRGSLALCISIVLSTMFIKQHSIFDVLTAFVLIGVMYYVVYGSESAKAYKALKEKEKEHKEKVLVFK